MTIHIGAESGQVAQTVLLPGDPLRAKWAAETFLDNPICINNVRGMLGFTGTWNGHPVTIQGSGMGMPSLSIYVNELIRDFDARVLIRIGSTGAMQNDIALRDVVLAMSATTLSSPSQAIFGDMRYAPTADFDLLHAAYHAAKDRGVTTHIGPVYSSDTFYDERPDLTEQMTRHGVLAVEMETAELYTLAARHNRRALAVLTVSDHLLSGESLPASARERSFADMIHVALTAAFS